MPTTAMTVPNDTSRSSSHPMVAIETLPPPVEVETAINAVWRGNRLLTPIGGGVTLHPRMALDAANLLSDESGGVGKARAETATLPKTGWYWD